MKTFASRLTAMMPFTLLGGAAIVTGGILAARFAAHPVPVLLWLVAYLVLVVGVAQYALGWGQTRLAARTPPVYFVAVEWLTFNLGNAGVIAGTLRGNFRSTVAGSILVIIAMLLFAVGVVGSRRHPWWQIPYYALAALILASAVVGIILAAR